MQQLISVRAAEGQSKSSPVRLIHLDMLRGLAALAVLLGHIRIVFFVLYKDVAPDIKTPDLLLKALYFLMGFHHYAVVVFFVLSGFFIASSVLKAWHGDRWSWKTYLINRLTRLYVVLIPALILGATWDYFGETIFFNSTIYQSDRIGVEQHPGWQSFLGNLFFLQTIFVRPFGSNNALWSLSYEFWYYILFPILVFTLVPRLPMQKRVLYGSCGLILLVILGKNLALYFLIWLMGAAISVLRPIQFLSHPVRARVLSTISLIGLLAVVMLIRSQQFQDGLAGFLGDFVIGVATSLFVYAVLHLKPTASKGIYAKTAITLGDFSYTLYLAHSPFLIFSGAWLAPRALLQPTFANLGLTAIIIILCIAYVLVLAHLTEAKTSFVRIAIMRWMQLKPASYGFTSVWTYYRTRNLEKKN